MSYSLEEKLAYAEQQRALASNAMESADPSEDYLREHAGGLGYGGSNAHRGANKIHAQSRANAGRYVAAKERHDHWDEKAKGYTRRIAERDRVRLTREDLAGATHVRLSTGWWEVVRLNKTTVTVKTGYSWTDRHEFDKVLEARTRGGAV